ncbi:MAG: hypothetical protein PWP23_2202 [Candidatus Sumerlaeota bacterium]|nr:hypothetical protein [Candidatus Sumerlaeota bacterium]
MRKQDRSKLIARLRASQRLAQQHPTLYRIEVRLMMALGRAYLAGLVFLSFLTAFCIVPFLCYLVVSQKAVVPGAIGLAVVGLPLGGLFLSLIQMSRLDVPIPAGIILTQRDAPALFDEIESLCRRLRLPRIHRLLLSPELNAGVYVRPRLGVFGGCETYLQLGLPLMQAFAPEQCAAVLAHELGHVSGRINRLYRRVFLFTRKWEQLHENLEANGGTLLLSLFTRWYVPELRILTHAMNRSLEFEADRIAIESKGSEASAGVLVLSTALGHVLNSEFWPRMFARSFTAPCPPEDIYAEQGNFLQSPECRRLLPGWMRWAWRRQPSPFDSHPTLSERLKACGIDDCDAIRPSWFALPEATAARHYLGENEDELAAVLGSTWSRTVEAGWRANYHTATGHRALLEQLWKRKREGEELPWGELWQLAVLTEDLEGRRAAFPCYREALERDRENVRANFAFGRLLLEENDERGTPYLEYAMEADPFLVEDACMAICAFLYRQHRFEEARPYEEHAAAFSAEHIEALNERENVDASDTYLPHCLEEKELAELQARLGDIQDLAGAWLARKELEFLPERPLFVLVLRPGTLKGWDAEVLQSVARLLDFEHDLIVVLPRGAQRKLCRKIMRTDGTKLFDLNEDHP